jgi:hypothetical protein
MIACANERNASLLAILQRVQPSKNEASKNEVNYAVIQNSELKI